MEISLLDVQPDPRLSALERVEPLAAAWRTNVGEPRNPVDAGLTLRSAAKALRDRLWSAIPLDRPATGQVIVLTFGATPGSAGTVLPVLKGLAERGTPGFLVTNARTEKYMQLGLHRGHADYRQIALLNSRSIRNACRTRAHEIGAELDRFFPGDQASAWLVDGLLMREAVRQWIGNAKAVVTDSDHEVLRKGFVLAAEAQGVPAVVLQHGFMGAQLFPLHARSMYCWGSYFRNKALAFGAEPSTLKTVGCPRFDHLPCLRKAPIRAEVYSALGKRTGVPLILLLSNAHGASYYPEFYAEYFKTVERLLLSDCDVIVKLHPAEQGLEAYRGRVSRTALGNIRLLPPAVTLEDAIRHSDIVFQGFSAAALEAMLLGVPVLFQKGDSHMAARFDFPDHGGGLWASEQNVVEVCQNVALHHAQRSDLIARQDEFLKSAVANQGNATNIICESLLAGAVLPELICAD